MQRSKTVLWSLLLLVAIPAVSMAGEFWFEGQTAAAIGGFVVGFVAFILFFVSFVAEFPLEKDVKAALNTRQLSEAEVKEVASEVGESVKAVQRGERLDEEDVRRVAEAVADLLDADGDAES